MARSHPSTESIPPSPAHHPSSAARCPSRGPSFLLAACVAVAMIGWGWSWVGIRAAVRHYDPGPLAFGRYLVASLVLLPLWLRRGGRWPGRSDAPAVIAAGLLGLTIYNLCINAGERTVTAGTAAFIAAGIPVMLTLGGRLFFGERVTAAGSAGMAVAFAGVALSTVGAEGHIRVSPGALLILAAVVGTTGYGLLNKRLIARYRPLDVTTWAIWVGTLGLAGYAPALVRTAPQAPAGATLNLVLLGIIPGALCYTLWGFAMSRMSLARLASWMFAIPLAAVAFGWLLLGELPPPLASIGGAITLAGVFVVNTWGHPRV